MAKIIGLHGFAGAGKDTVAKHIVTYFPKDFRTIAFADAIRAMLKAGFPVLTDAHFERPLKNEPLAEFGGKSPRDLMQPLGTEWGRNLFDSIWIQRIAPTVLDFIGAGSNVIITDVRFENEAEWIRKNGGVVVHIQRPEGTETHTHKSEAGIKFVKGDKRILNDQTLGHLLMAAEKLAKEVLAEQSEAVVQ